MKRLGSFLMALILCAALAPPAFAAGGNAEQGTVTIENAEEGGEYKFYQILAPDGSGGYRVSDAWTLYNDPNYFVKFEDGKVFYLNVPGHPENGRTEIKSSDSASVGALLQLIQWNESITPACTVTAQGETVQAQLDYGYYLLDYGNGTGGLFHLDSQAKQIRKKSEADPSLKKKIVLASGEKVDWTTVQLGESVRFEVTVKLPSAKEWADSPGSYPCKIYDAVSSGLVLNRDVAVTIDGATVITGTEPVPDTNIVTGRCGEKAEADTVHLHYDEQDPKKFDIGFGQAYGSDGAVGGTLEFLNRHPGAELTLAYSARVIQHSEETPYEVNTAHLQYGTKNIYGNVQMYDFTIVIEKRDKDTNMPLGGAKFVLMNEDGKFYSSDRKQDNSYHAGDKVEWLEADFDPETGRFEPKDPGKLDSMVLETAVKNTDQNNWDGKNHFEGIPAGIYYLYEIKAPDGYDRLKTPITIVIQPASDGRVVPETYTYQGLGETALGFSRVVFESTINGGEASEITKGDVPWGGDWNQLRVTAGVGNSKASFHLPSTGGMGTAIFYAVGGVLLAGAAALLAAKRRTGRMG